MKMSSRLFPCATLRILQLLATGVAIVAIPCAWLASANQCAAQLCVQLSGVNHSENFNTLATSGSGNLNTLPSGFAAVESGMGGTLTYSADNGSNSSADTYSYGTTGSSD